MELLHDLFIFCFSGFSIPTFATPLLLRLPITFGSLGDGTECWPLWFFLALLCFHWLLQYKFPYIFQLHSLIPRSWISVSITQSPGGLIHSTIVRHADNTKGQSNGRRSNSKGRKGMESILNSIGTPSWKSKVM